MRTDELIRQIARTAVPVQRLKPPWRRALGWLVIAVPYVAVATWFYPATPPLAAMHGARFAVEEIAAAATAITAAWAAFCSTVPGYDRRVLWLPLAPLAVWLASVGSGCIADWLRFGIGAMAPRADWGCLPASLALGWLPLAAIVVMLRRGAPLRPHLSIALGALAAAGLGNVGLQTFHVADASIIVLVWHVGGALVLSIVIGAAGNLLLNWRQARSKALRAVMPAKAGIQ